MSRQQQQILAGAGLMAFGTFLPIVSLPLVGSQNYFQNGQGDGVLIVAMAVITAGMAFSKAVRFAWIPAGVAGGLLLYTLVNLMSLISDIQADIESSLEGNPFAGLAQGLAGTIQLQWGWMVMLAGVATAVYGALRKSTTVKAEDVGDGE